MRKKVIFAVIITYFSGFRKYIICKRFSCGIVKTHLPEREKSCIIGASEKAGGIGLQIIVIGGGASGMMAAITAAKMHQNDHVVLLERQARVGRKLLATGNGRCNLTNLQLQGRHFHGSAPEFAAFALSQFDPLDWFHRHGLLTVAEPSGRVYPLSDSANSVLDVLRFALQQPNLEQQLGCEVTGVKKNGDTFFVKTATQTLTAQRVIVACGGLAGTKLGGGMSGYQILRSFGHRATRLAPALVQINTEDTYVKALKGVRADAAVTLCRGEETLARCEGQVQFTANGVSGPAIFDISRVASTQSGDLTLHLDLLREYSLPVVQELLEQRARQFPQLTGEDLFTGMLHNRLGRTLLRYAKIPVLPLAQTNPAQAAAAAKDFALPVVGTMGMDCAQVTAGGILTGDFNDKTMESRLCSGLFACGEVLDIDGDCGGYNLHWAWASGHLAGMGGSHDSDS